MTMKKINKRYLILRRIFEARKCFKLVCGAGNEDPQEVRRLAFVFTLAGATMLDLSANVPVVKAAAEGIKMAYAFAPALNKKIPLKPYLNVSIGLKGDPHIRKAGIDRKICSKCGRCIQKCAQEAIAEDFIVKEYRCVGCGYCEAACPKKAVNFAAKRADFNKILPECIANGVETLELHAVVEDDGDVFRDWQLLNDLVKDNFISMCIDRSLLSNKRFNERVKKAYQISGERLIVQADGIPMSGAEGDTYNNTLQAVACADIVQKSGIPAMVLLSGGTNSKTGILSRQCNVTAHGVAVGSFARMLVRDQIKRDDFDNNVSLIKKTAAKAEKLVKANIEAISG